MLNYLSQDQQVLLKEYLRRKVLRSDQRKKICSNLFEQQREFLEDPARSKAALCTRRAGKTFTAASMLFDAALTRNSVDALYLSLTRKNAKLIIWEELRRFNTKHGLSSKFNAVDLIVELQNGSRIILGGADDQSEVDKYRGLSLVLAIIDEAQAFKQSIITALIEEVLQPTLLDWDGTLALIGTPNANCVGYFHDATNLPNPEWVVHKWSVVQNPHVPKDKSRYKNAREWIDEVKRKKNWSDQNPVYQREWLGRWIRSLDSIVYRFNRDRDLLNSLPTDHDIQYVLGVDLGFDDASAFVVLGFAMERKQVFIIEAFKQSSLTVDKIAEHTRKLDQRYKFVRKVADTGGLGKMIVHELNKRHMLDIKPAEKKDKHDFIELMNSDFESSRIKVLDSKENLSLIEEWQILQWDEDRKKEDERYENHLADAALYAWRECLHWIGEIKEKLPDFGSDHWWKREAERMEQQEIDEHHARNSDAFFDEW